MIVVSAVLTGFLSGPSKASVPVREPEAPGGSNGVPDGTGAANTPRSAQRIVTNRDMTSEGLG